MSDYEEFRLQLTPDLQTAGKWKVQILSCPIQRLIEPAGDVTPGLNQQHMQLLRSHDNWPNLATLQAIGRQVWECVMTPKARAAYDACLAFVTTIRTPNCGLRITLAMVGDEPLPADQNAIRLSELPVEAMYNDQDAFVATNLLTPISRSLQIQPDHPPQKVALPLRILVIAATPGDKPPAQAAQEEQAIRDSLSPLTGPGGPVMLDFCQPATRSELSKRLMENSYHVLHFIGHGGFDEVDDDHSPHAYLAFCRPDMNTTDPVDADDLNTLLRNTTVNLVVMTACQSAAPVPVGAFKGIAQRLLTGQSSVSAAVAMQFDMEAPAAVIFTQSFYQNLLHPGGKSLDEVVTLARRELINTPGFGNGHRAWVTPTVYWRCMGGKVFEVCPYIGAMAKVPPEIDISIKFYRNLIDKIYRKGPNAATQYQDLLTEYRLELEELAKERGELLGETVRLWGGLVKPGQEVSCRITVRPRLPHTIDLIKFLVCYPATQLAFVAAVSGAHLPATPFTNAVNPGQLQVAWHYPSGSNYGPGEYEVGQLKFSVAAGQQPGIIDLQMAEIQVQSNGQNLPFTSLNGIIFVESNS